MNSEDYYLSIGGDKSKLQCLFFRFDFLGRFAHCGRKISVATTRAPYGLGLLMFWVSLWFGLPNPTKKLADLMDLLVFDSTAISAKHVFEIL